MLPTLILAVGSPGWLLAGALVDWGHVGCTRVASRTLKLRPTDHGA